MTRKNLSIHPNSDYLLRKKREGKKFTYKQTKKRVDIDLDIN